MPLLAFLVIAVTLPFAIVDTIETGRVYVFSRQFQIQMDSAERSAITCLQSTLKLIIELKCSAPRGISRQRLRVQFCVAEPEAS